METAAATDFQGANIRALTLGAPSWYEKLRKLNVLKDSANDEGIGRIG